jgi:hypothetical protein
MRMPLFLHERALHKESGALVKEVYPKEELPIPNITRLLNGREIILGPYPNPPHRIGWVWKDTGLPPTEEDNFIN